MHMQVILLLTFMQVASGAPWFISGMYNGKYNDVKDGKYNGMSADSMIQATPSVPSWSQYMEEGR